MCHPCPRTSVTHVSGLYTLLVGVPGKFHLKYYFFTETSGSVLPETAIGLEPSARRFKPVTR